VRRRINAFIIDAILSLNSVICSQKYPKNSLSENKEAIIY
jgi:hypothetical protein